MIDPFSAEFRKNLYPNYSHLRQQHPVQYFPDRNLWTITRYKDVLDVLRNPGIFSSTGRKIEPSLIGADPPNHTRVRRIVSKFQRVTSSPAFENVIRNLVEELLNRIQPGTACEFMANFAHRLPLFVMAHVLGIDPALHDKYRRWVFFSVYKHTQAKPELSAEDEVEFDAFFEDLVRRSTRNDSEGLLADLLSGSSDDDRLTPLEAFDIGRILLIAGSETTSNLIGNMLYILLKHPEVFEKVRNYPSLLPAAIEECIRYETVPQMIRRWVKEDTFINGVPIPKGSSLMLLLGCANRDPARFVDPDVFDMDRDNSDHLGFGAGPHYCLGAKLARLETQLALEGILLRMKKIKSLSPIDSIEFLDSFLMRGLKNLELVFET